MVKELKKFVAVLVIFGRQLLNIDKLLVNDWSVENVTKEHENVINYYMLTGDFNINDEWYKKKNLITKNVIITTLGCYN